MSSPSSHAEGDGSLLTTTHLVVVVLFAMFLELNRDEWFVAITFGVLVDADHLFAVRTYVDNNGWDAILRATWDDGSGFQWKSLMHYPVAAFVVAPLAVGWRYLVPLSFWALHVGLDELQNRTLEHSALVETTVLSLTVAGILLVDQRRWSAASGTSGAMPYLNSLWPRLSGWFRSSLPSRG